MTAQAGEVIIYKEKRHHMATEPLNDYLDTRDDITFKPEITSCWRGYVGKWKVKYKKLYLIELSGTLENVPLTIPLVDTMEHLFPGQKEVFAEWFTGEIRIPIGEMLEYVHMGYHSVFEKDLILEFENGVLISEKEIDNLELLKNK